MALRGLACAWLALATLAAVSQEVGPPGTVHVQGAGASFPSRVYGQWMQRYAQTHPGVTMDYRPVGSGQGVQRMVARDVHWAGSDVPLTPAQLRQHHLVQIPMLVGGLVPVVQVRGLDNQSLVLDGAVLADIMLGTVQRWDDPRVVALNPGLKLPPQAIVRVVREDASGSSEIWSRYLAQVSPLFAARVKPGTLPAWPGQTLRARGQDGVVELLRATPGGLAYVSFDRARQDRPLSAVRLRNRMGAVVTASEEAFRAAIAVSDLHRLGDDTATLLDLPRADAWPVTATSFVLLDARPTQEASAQAVVSFVRWCFMQGDALTRGTGFAPLPARVQARLAGRLQEVVMPSGQPGAWALP